ncbi:hypothetical protein COC42_09905 [Sphingomonas spermidinifaciens]|uniref:Uncharacterized protein n=1 Tax=Sphingomonas spermidinifaciens TaxID=1141889 RepID=A0A2A4BA82_9SPHN|nr:hypothetical protein [Sphingomonas spermidinifaciens]PCD04544.1 hypothetical protein COC42_09905 [Sphingomonas spermidinifaciens]
MVTPVQQSAVDDIRGKLDTSGLFNTVTHGEMNDIAARLRGLSAADADAVIDELARTGDLSRLADEAVDGSWFGNGGYSADERGALFADMAGKLDAQSLRTLSDAFAATDAGGNDGHARVGELASAIATHAAPQTRVDFVREMAGQTTDSESINSAGIGGSSIRDVDAEASAVGTVLGSLNGAQAQAAFEALSPEQLRAVMRSGLDARLDTSSMGGGAVASWDVGNLRGVLDAAATIPDADRKAQIFDAGVDTMRTVRDTSTIIGGLTTIGKDDAMASIRDGLTAIINSDTAGVVSELNRNTPTRQGDDFAAYAKEMLASGQEARLGEQMARIQFGNANNENPVDRLYAETPVPGTPGDVRLQNTEALGYFIGGVTRAANSITSDVQAQRAMTTNVLNSVLSVVDKVGGRIYGNAVGIPASVATRWVQTAAEAAIGDPTANAADQLTRTALPEHPATGESAVGTRVEEAFTAARVRVQSSTAGL